MLKSVVQKILEKPFGYDWSLQGFGMLRLYLSDTERLHIWDDRFANESVSLIHDHPWDFTSRVVAGNVTNYRYYETSYPRDGSDMYFSQVIQCGPGGCVKGQPESVWLDKMYCDLITEGNTYHQLSDEIHSSHPDRGTVTIIDRRFKADTEHARVFWAVNEEWGTAEPRPATEEEVKAITEYSLEKWFK